MSTNDQIKRLGNFILAQCPREVNAEDLPQGEGAVNVAIRVLNRMAGGAERALLSLADAENYSPPVANAISLLREALGLWGKT